MLNFQEFCFQKEKRKKKKERNPETPDLFLVDRCIVFSETSRFAYLTSRFLNIIFRSKLNEMKLHQILNYF